jgi:hypothetical protein
MGKKVTTTQNSVEMMAINGTRWAGRVAHREEMRNSYYSLFVKTEGKRPLGIQTSR